MKDEVVEELGAVPGVLNGGARVDLQRLLDLELGHTLQPLTLQPHLPEPWPTVLQLMLNSIKKTWRTLSNKIV